ncbi:MAG: M48 family metalloprotease [Alphaproteobacteria bacterium]
MTTQPIIFSEDEIEELKIQPQGKHQRLEDWVNEVMQRVYAALPTEKKIGALTSCPQVLLSARRMIYASIASSSNPAIALVSAGLLELLETEDELAGVLGHELWHPVLNHRQQYFSQYVEDNRDRARSNEYMADLYGGVNLVAEAGYHWHGLPNFFNRLATEDGFSLNDYIGSHPGDLSRVRNMKNEATALAQRKYLPDFTPLPPWLSEEIEQLQGENTIDLWLTEKGFEKKSDAQKIDLLATIFTQQPDLLTNPFLFCRRLAIVDAARNINWAEPEQDQRAHHQAREKLGWALLKFQHIAPDDFADGFWAIVQRTWRDDNTNKLYYSGTPKLRITEEGEFKLSRSNRLAVDHFVDYHQSFFPAFNRLVEAANSFAYSSHDAIMIEAATELTTLIEKIHWGLIKEGSDEAPPVHSIEGRLYDQIPHFLWETNPDWALDPTSWTPHIQAFHRNREQVLLKALVYLGVTVDPRIPELAILAETMQQEADRSGKKLSLNTVKFIYSYKDEDGRQENNNINTDLTIENYGTLYATPSLEYRRYQRPRNPGYFLKKQEMPSYRYYQELDGWQEYREAESLRLAERDLKEQQLLARTNWQDLADDWHGFINTHKKQLTPELSICAGGWLFAEKFLQEAEKLVTENPEKFYPLLLAFFMEGAAHCTDNQQLYWNGYGTEPFFIQNILDERKRWVISGYGELEERKKIMGGLLAMHPNHPYSRFIIEDPINIFSWMDKIKLLEDSNFLEHTPPTPSLPYGKASLIADYIPLFEPLNKLDDFSDLLTALPWRRQDDTTNEKLAHEGEVIYYGDMLSFYIANRARCALQEEGWQPQTMQEYGLLCDMFASIVYLDSIWLSNSSDWTVPYYYQEQEGENHSPNDYDAVGYIIHQQSTSWVGRLLRPLQGVELAETYVDAIELKARDVCSEGMRHAEDRLCDYLSAHAGDNPLHKAEKLFIAQILLFDRRETMKDKGFLRKPHDGTIISIPLKMVAEEIIQQHIISELGQDDHSPEWLAKAQAILLPLSKQLGGQSKIAILEKISHAVLAQYELASWINDLCTAILQQQSMGDTEQGLCEMLLDMASLNSDIAHQLKGFFSHSASAEAATQLLDTINESGVAHYWGMDFYSSLKNDIRKKSLIDYLLRVHEGLWILPQPAKAVILDRLYFPLHQPRDDEDNNALSLAERHEQSVNDIINLLLGDKKSQFDRPLTVFLSSIEKDEKRLLLSMLLAGRKPDGGSFSEAKLLREICQSFPPLGPKLAQAISNHHATSEDIRAELRQTKYMAENVSRFTILDMARKEGHEVGKNGLKLFGKLLGVGANAYALQLEKEAGSSSVLYMLKDNVLARAEIMGAKLLKAAQQLAAEDHSYHHWPEILSNALELLREELELEKAPIKAAKAEEFYTQVSIYFGEQLWSNKSTQIISMGQQSLEMSYMQGTMLAKHYEAASPLAWRAAVVSLITEFLAQGGEIGLGFERDPHDGNANVHAVNDNMVEIGQYDFFGWREQPATAEEKQALGKAMGKIILGALTGKFNLATGELPKDHERAQLALGRTCREAGLLGLTAAMGALLNANAIPQVEEAMQETMGMAYKPFKATACRTAKIYNIALKQ